MKKLASEQRPRDFQCKKKKKPCPMWTVGLGRCSKPRGSYLSKDIALREFLHRDSVVFAILCYISILCTRLGILQAITAHLGCFVVDRVDEDEDD